MIDYKTATRKELTREFKRLQRITNDKNFTTHIEFWKFPEIVLPNEQAIAVSSGRMEGNFWLIILTNQRIIFLDTFWLTGLKQVALDLSSITSVIGEKTAVFGKIIITAGYSHTYTITRVSKISITPFTDLVKQAIEDFNSQHKNSQPTQGQNNDDFITKLERLANLRDKGIITEQEFQDQKSKLLR